MNIPWRCRQTSPGELQKQRRRSEYWRGQARRRHTCWRDGDESWEDGYKEINLIGRRRAKEEVPGQVLVRAEGDSEGESILSISLDGRKLLVHIYSSREDCDRDRSRTSSGRRSRARRDSRGRRLRGWRIPSFCGKIVLIIINKYLSIININLKKTNQNDNETERSCCINSKGSRQNDAKFHLIHFQQKVPRPNSVKILAS